MGLVAVWRVICGEGNFSTGSGLTKMVSGD